jgi:hypothetical protein
VRGRGGDPGAAHRSQTLTKTRCAAS